MIMSVYILHQNKKLKEMKKWKNLESYPMINMVILNKLESIDKRILKRVLVIGIHNLNECEKASLYEALKK